MCIIVYCATREKKIILRVWSLVPEQSEGNNQNTFRVSVEWFQSVQLRLGGIETCYNNNIDKYCTKCGGKGLLGRSSGDGVGGKAPAGGFGGLCPPHFEKQIGLGKYIPFLATVQRT